MVWITIVASTVGFISIIGAYWLTAYLQAVLIGFGFVAISLALGLVVINHFLQLSEKRAAVGPLLNMVGPALSEFHDQLLDKAWEVFGKEDFDRVIDKYLNGDLDPLSLNATERNQISTIVINEYEAISLILNRIEIELKELAFVVGWSLDPQLIGSSYECRLSIARLRTEVEDNNAKDETKICEHYLDIALHADTVFATLASIADISSKQIKDIANQS